AAPHDGAASLPLAGCLSGLLISPGECGQGLHMTGVAQQALLCQGNHLLSMAEAALQFEIDIEKNVLLLPTAPTDITDMLHRWSHQARCCGVVSAHERYLTAEQVRPERRPISTVRHFKQAP